MSRCCSKSEPLRRPRRPETQWHGPKGRAPPQVGRPRARVSDTRPGPVHFSRSELSQLSRSPAICSRYALRVTAHPAVTGPLVVASFRQAVAANGVPSSTLTDNGMVFTTRLSGGKGGRNGLEAELRRLNVRQKNARPNHPTTCGKVERFQQTMKCWLRAQPCQPTSIDQLQAMLDAFVQLYNEQRPHRGLRQRASPSVVYHTRPKATPTAAGDGDDHHRFARAVVDADGL